MKRYRGIVVVVLLLGTWVIVEVALFRRNVPPLSVTDIHSYLGWRPETARLCILGGQGGNHLMATGPGGGLLPSGPSAYIFDRSGRLVDWCPDTGDNSTFNDRWPSNCGFPLSPSQVGTWVIPATRPASRPPQ